MDSFLLLRRLVAAIVFKGQTVSDYWWSRRTIFLTDGGRGVCSSDVHRLVQKLVSTAEMQFTHATRSPRASQIAGRVVCGSKVDIAAGVSARDSVAMEKSFLQLVFEVLCDATATLVQLPDCRPPHLLYTLASEPQPSVRESCVVCASSNGLW